MRSLRALQQSSNQITQQVLRATQQRYSSSLIRHRTPNQSPILNIWSRNFQQPAIRHLIKRRLTTKPPSKPSYDPTPHLGSPEPSLSFSQRLRKLSREYGWSALGIYLLLSALDFPFCFLAVRWLGTDRIGHWEHVVIEWVKRASPIQVPAWKKSPAVEVAGTGVKVEEYGVVDPKSNEVGLPGYDHGVKEAEKRNQSENASLWTQLALAYAIHKSFIFLRVPLTAAVTPKVVKVLRGWGWDIGKRKPKTPRSITSSSTSKTD
ncbi:hypothetical protein MMC14_000544 [Varicellaria rhodocarpa]|nr:hypothetical protein [Varicellaria rhodocarpa]